MALFVGGAAGKLVEKAWDSGEKWIQTYFRDHQPKAQEAAKENVRDFLASFACRVKQLEEQDSLQKETIENAQNRPDFSLLLQKALLSASETESKGKHQILADLVAKKLALPIEDTLSLAIPRACEAVAALTMNQLKVLGLQLAALYNGPEAPLDEAAYHDWLVRSLTPFLDVKIDHLDLIHLEALSCIQQQSFILWDFSTVRKELNGGAFDWIRFKDCEAGKKFEKLWGMRGGLTSVKLTSVGYLIGKTVVTQCDNSPHRSKQENPPQVELDQGREKDFGVWLEVRETQT